MKYSITGCQYVQKGMAMDKLIANLAARFPDLTEEDISLSVETIINAMRLQLISGGRIELRGFGSFRLNTDLVETCPSQIFDRHDDIKQSVVIFKPGQVIRQRINDQA